MSDVGSSAVLVLDASAMVDLLLDTDTAALQAAVSAGRCVVPAHFDAEVLSAIGRLHRAEELSDEAATARVERLAVAPLSREPLAPLLAGAWARRGDTRLADALYLELAALLDTVVVTTDRRLARAHPGAAVLPEDLP